MVRDNIGVTFVLFLCRWIGCDQCGGHPKFQQNHPIQSQCAVEPLARELAESSGRIFFMTKNEICRLSFGWTRNPWQADGEEDGRMFFD